MAAHPAVHYEQVADVYIEALQEGGRTGPTPNVAIAVTWNVPITTAARWVKECRRRGLLPPAVRGSRAKCRGRCAVCCPHPRHGES